MRVPAGFDLAVKHPERLSMGYLFLCLELLDLAKAGAPDRELMNRVERYLAEGGDAKST